MTAPRAMVPLLIAVSAGLLASLALFMLADGWVRTERQSQFVQLAEDHTAAIRRNVNRKLEILYSIGNFYAASREIERGEFQSFVEGVLDRNPDILVIEWLARVPLDERPAYETTIHQEGLAGFRITDASDELALRPSGPRDTYFPVTYIEPMASNHGALGIDHSSDPLRWQAMANARDTARPTATPQILLRSLGSLRQEPVEQLGVIIYLPIYRNGVPHATLEERQAHLMGFAALIVQVKALVTAAYREIRPDGLDLAIVDTSAEDGGRLLYANYPALREQLRSDQSPAPVLPAGGRSMTWSTECEFANRTWTIVMSAAPNGRAAWPWEPWAALAIGVSLTAILAGYVLNAAKRQVEVERIVTERTKDLMTMQAQLIQAEKMSAVGVLASGIAHEVKNPLQIIMQGTEYLIQELGEEDGLKAEATRTIKEAVVRADRIIRGILRFSRPAKLKLLPCALASIVQESLVLVEKQLSVKNILVTVDVPTALPLLLLDEDQMRHVFINLILNAFQAMPRGGLLTIRAKARAEQERTVLICEVSDTGCGIPREHLNRVIEPFFTTKAPGQGTGLGLSICRTIIEQHGGTLAIDSVEGKGTTLQLTFPIMKGA